MAYMTFEERVAAYRQDSTGTSVEATTTGTQRGKKTGTGDTFEERVAAYRQDSTSRNATERTSKRILSPARRVNADDYRGENRRLAEEYNTAVDSYNAEREGYLSTARKAVADAKFASSQERMKYTAQNIGHQLDRAQQEEADAVEAWLADDGWGGIGDDETSRALRSAARERGAYEDMLKYDEMSDRLYDDDLFGQFGASYTLGQMSIEQNRAGFNWKREDTDYNRMRAEAAQRATAQFQDRNAETLADDATLPLVTQSFAQYLPQLMEQTKYGGLPAVGGAIVGGFFGNPIEGAKTGASIGSGLFNYEQAAGAAYIALRDAGYDHETASAMSAQESVVSALIESVDTYLDLTMFSPKTLLKGVGAKATAAITKQLPKIAAKTGISVTALETLFGIAKGTVKLGLTSAGEGTEELAQNILSDANLRRDGNTGFSGLLGETWDYGKDVLGADPKLVARYEQMYNDPDSMSEDELEMLAFMAKSDPEYAAALSNVEGWEAFEEGAKIGGMMGGVQAGLSAGIDEFSTQSVGKRYNQGTEVIEGLIEQGLVSGPDTESFRLATELKRKLDNGEELTNRQVGRLVMANESAIAAETVAEETPEAAEQTPAETEKIAPVVAETVTETEKPTRNTVPLNAMSTSNPRRMAWTNSVAAVQQETGYGRHGAETFLDVLETENEVGSKSAEQVRAEFQSSYEAGMLNIPENKLKFATTVQRMAYNAGRMDFVANQNRGKNNAAVVHGDSSGFDMTSLPKDVTPTQAKLVDILSKGLGAKTRMASGLKGNGEIHSNGEVLLSDTFERSVGGKSVSIVYHAAHELGMHRLVQLAPEEGRAFIGALYQHLNEDRPVSVDTLAQKKQTQYGEQGVHLTTVKAMEEVAANEILSLYENEEAFIRAVERIVNGNDEKAKQGAKTFREILDDIVQRLKDFINKLRGKEKAEAQAALTEVEYLRDLYEKALTAAVAKNREMEQSVEPKTETKPKAETKAKPAAKSETKPKEKPKTETKPKAKGKALDTILDNYKAHRELGIYDLAWGDDELTLRQARASIRAAYEAGRNGVAESEVELPSRWHKDAYAAGLQERKNTADDGGVMYSLPDIKTITPSPEILGENIKRVSSMKSVYSVAKEMLLSQGMSIKDVYRKFFSEWGENIHSELLGDISAKNSSMRSEIRHGNTAAKIASIEAIPSVIHHGEIVDWFYKDANNDLLRIVVAAPINIGEDSYFMGVMLQRDRQNQRLYLHDVVIEKETFNDSPEHLVTTGSGENSESLYMSSILKKIRDVKQFSLKSTDSEGRELSEGQREYFRDSVVRDSKGNLLVVYHGARKADRTVFTRNVTYFTDNRDMADSYAPTGEMYAGYLKITKPFEIDAKGAKWSGIPIDVATKRLLDKYGGSTFREKGAWRTSPADLASAIEEAIDEGELDYDGIIIRNVDDTGSYWKTTEKHIGDDFIIFNSNQFKNTDNLHPTEDEDIRYSLKGVSIPTREELEQKPPVKVVDISKPKTKGSFAYRRQEIMKGIHAVIAKPYFNQDTKTLIFLTKKSYTHAFSDNSKWKLNAAEHLPELIETAVLTHGEAPTHGNMRADGVYTFFAAAKTDRGIQPVKLKVKEYPINAEAMPKNIRDYFKELPSEYATSYDTVVLEVEEIEESPQGSAIGTNNDVRRHSPGELSEIRVADLLDLVKGDAAKYVPKQQYSLKGVAEDSDSAYTEDSGIQYSMKPKWKPKLKPEEWGIVHSVMNGYHPNDTWEADEITIGFFSKAKGYQVFGYYSTDDDTLLYAVGGKKAAKDNTRREEVYRRVINNGTDRTRRSVDRRIDGLGSQSWDRGVHPNSATKRRATVGTGGLSAAVSENRGQNTEQGRNHGGSGKNPESKLKQHSLKGQSDILRENARLRKVNARLRDQFKRTKFAKVDEKSLDRFARQLLRDYGSELDSDDIRGKLDELYTYMANGENGESPMWSEVQQRAYDIAQVVLENALAVDNELHQQYSDLRHTLRATGITLDARYSGDLQGYESLEAFRRANLGRIKITKNGTPVDVFYQELAESYPEFFDDTEYSHPADQLMHIEEVLDKLEPVAFNPYDSGMQEHIAGLAYDIIDRFFELPQAKPTYADKAATKLAAQKAYDRKKLDKLRAEKNAKIERVEQHYRDKESKMSESRKASVLRKKIQRHAAQMSRKLMKPTDRQHIPEIYRSAVTMLLEAINLESGYELVYGRDGGYHRVARGTELGAEATKRTEAFEALRDEYREMIADEQMVIDPDLLGGEGVKGKFDKVIAMKDKPIANMSSTELQIMWEVLRSVEKSISDYGKILSTKKFWEVRTWADAMVEDTKSRKGKKGRAVEKLRVDLENPYTFFSHYGEAGKEIFRMLRDAQDHQQEMVSEIRDKVREIVDKKTVEKWEKETHTFTTERDEELTLTTAQCMEVYLLMKREQAHDHLMQGGIVQPEIKHKGITRGTDAILLSAADLARIVGTVTADSEQVRVADALQKLTATTLAEYGNAASMRAYGYRKFTGADYWTIKSAREGVHSNVEKGGNNTRSIKNIGLAQSVVPHANNPLDIGGVFETFAAHAGDMMDYAAWLCPMEDAARLYNFRFRDADGSQTGKTIKGLLDRVGGKGAQQYWANLMEDIQNGLAATNDSAFLEPIGKVIGNAKGASVGANIRVIVQQPTAIFRAAVVLSPESMTKGLAKGVTDGNGWQKALEYTAIAKRKDMGGFDISSPMQMRETLFDTKGRLQRFNEWMMTPAGMADAVTWGKIWNACEWEVKGTSDIEVGSDAFYTAVAELFTEVIDQTQVVDGVLQRSQTMRSGNAIMKQATAFMGEPTMAMNMVLRAYDAVMNEQDKKVRGKAIKTFGRTVTTLLVTNAVNAMAQSIVDAWRDDEDDDDYWDKFWRAFIGLEGDEETFGEKLSAVFLEGNLGNSLNLLTYIPIVKDAMSLLQGYNVTRADADVMGDIISAVQSFNDSVFGDGKKTVAYAAKNLVQQVCKAAGISAPNVLRDVWGIMRTFAHATDSVVVQYEMEKAIHKISNTDNKGRFIDIAFTAWQKGDMDTYDKIVEELVDNGVALSTIESGIRSRAKKAGIDANSLGDITFVAGMRPYYAEAEDEGETNFSKDALSGADATDYSRLYGEITEELIADMMSSPAYRSLDDETRNALLKAAYDYAEDTALQQFATKDDNFALGAQWMYDAQEAEKAGVDAGDYILYFKGTDGMDDTEKLDFIDRMGLSTADRNELIERVFFTDSEMETIAKYLSDDEYDDMAKGYVGYYRDITDGADFSDWGSEVEEDILAKAARYAYQSALEDTSGGSYVSTSQFGAGSAKGTEYIERAHNSGLSYEDIFEALYWSGTFDGVQVNGKTVTNSKKNEFIDWMRMQGYTKAEQELLLRACGWKSGL